ncbi:MAG TPA: MFS transporter [Anaerolineales bacterium]|jgi:MFS family permease
MKSIQRPSGLPAFIIIWIGQIISIVASAMSQFGLTIWMYQQTQSATAMGLMQVFFITPFLVMSPLAGVMVDRYNRKLMMMVSDLAAVIATFGIFLLYLSGHLQFWHLYVAAVINGAGNTFQWPAYSAVISTMVPKKQLGRVNGLTSLMEAGPGVVAPALAGALMPLVGLTGLLFFDFATFFIAIGALLLVTIPATPRTAEGSLAVEGGLLREAAFGFKYIFARPSLLGLQMVFFFGNLFSGMAFTVFAPMILARTGQNSLIFGTVESMLAAGAIIGGVVMTAWGGFKQRVHGVLLGWAIASLGTIMLGLGQGLSIWIPAAILSMVVSPLINGSNQAIWQAKVAPDLQGRVFSARRLIAWFTNPISPLLAGTLADFVFEPAMRSNGALASPFGGLTGTGPGAGMGLLMVLCGIIGVIVALGGYLVPPIRRAEELLPDFDQPLTNEIPQG